MESKFEKKTKNQIQFEQSNDPYVEIYIPISFFNRDGKADFPLERRFENPLSSYIDKLTFTRNWFNSFAEQFNFRALADRLNKLSNKYELQVGIVDKEAVDLVNQHKHWELMSIVKVQVARESLMYPEEGKSYRTRTFKASSSTFFFMLKKDTLFNVENIISARAMQCGDTQKNEFNEYCNSFFHGSVYPDDCWPKGLIVKNPSYLNQLELIKNTKNSDAVKDTNIVYSITHSNFFRQEPSNLSNQENDKLVKYLDKCSIPTRQYILSLISKPKLSDRIQELDLSSEEEVKFEKFKDNILTKKYMDLPVSLNENYYDMNTLIDLTQDPADKHEFSPLEISSGRNLINELENIIQQLKNEREIQSSINSTITSMW